MFTAIDIDADGNSIATQREACLVRAKRVKAPVIKEFVEPGNSAQTIAKRPVFRQLLQYVEEHPEISYVVIYMRSRAFRNSGDPAITKRILAGMGVKLISAKEDFGDGYMAEAMEAVTDIMNEVQVRQSGEDISRSCSTRRRTVAPSGAPSSATSMTAGTSTGASSTRSVSTRRGHPSSGGRSSNTPPATTAPPSWLHSSQSKSSRPGSPASGPSVHCHGANSVSSSATRTTSEWSPSRDTSTQVGTRHSSLRRSSTVCSRSSTPA